MNRAALALGLLFAGSCGDAAPAEPQEAAGPARAEPARGWPPGTVLAVDEVPVLAAEVDRIADALGALYPGQVETHNRRVALTNHVLETWAVRSRDAALRGEALERCRRARERIAAGEEPEALQEVAGGHLGLGLGLWAAARELEPGAWSEPVELVGRWVLLRVDERADAVDPRREYLRLSTLTFPFLDLSYRPGLDAGTSVEEAVDRARLTIVDPAWAAAVPAEWRYRMGAGDG